MRLPYRPPDPDDYPSAAELEVDRTHCRECGVLLTDQECAICSRCYRVLEEEHS